MRERREDVALAQEALDLHARSDERQLERDLAFELAVAALGEPHAAHATDTDLADQPVRSDDSSGRPAVAQLDCGRTGPRQTRRVFRDDVAQCRREMPGALECRAIQEPCRIQRGELGEQSTNGLGDVRLLPGESLEPGRARLLRPAPGFPGAVPWVSTLKRTADSTERSDRIQLRAPPGFHLRRQCPIVRWELAKPPTNVCNSALGVRLEILGNIMRIVLLTALMAMAAIAWGDESSAPAPQAEAKSEAAADATADAAADKSTEQTTAVAQPEEKQERVFKPPTGYRAKRVNGDQVYCTKVVVLGSRFPKEDCRTEAQLRDMEAQKAAMRSEMEQRNKVCAGGGACQSF